MFGLNSISRDSVDFTSESITPIFILQKAWRLLQITPAIIRKLLQRFAIAANSVSSRVTITLPR